MLLRIYPIVLYWLKTVTNVPEKTKGCMTMKIGIHVKYT